ncbi:MULTISPECIES: 16S rRNA (adenine(1518)-N(6)/adenine(1519)-N(6))-dimethyltransferase RsmA [Pseudanabaena]|uniref:Ribosomal RNA small subunit methyltransferase A n=2 Tax=Pseudanabaena TaxID=1152 RepID=L8MTI1_9CYAN|nr:MULTISPECIES: 16S rRNA (adenine(1518)-N(6)/adenine(1519)-N(6))-dimethyltransferase RsmA [Pseudanabaena]ELS30746.1 dimethyladenosine transferase [Pseudanabaena biceps PCC 7429]MDG3496987.1 16S rRNA (adenine(1518)-N(6)/adenine(1519)-N(6))-dimethyltransferase RsmA [Pseudanabaena catenata USMAC16]
MPNPESPIYSPSKIRPRKQFGQHWLRSDDVLNKILRAGQLQPSDRILEIGPGTGNLTRLLLPFVESLTAVEIDRDLCEKLRKTMTQKNFQLIEGSILDIPLPAETNKVIANIPYNITGEILKKLLGTLSEPVHQFEQIVLLVQKEIGDRLAAKAGHKAYNALSVKIQYLAECQFICDVPATAFYPPPKVNSAVVRIIPRPTPTPASSPRFLDRLLTLGFATKRKMLRNNLISEIDRDLLVLILENMGINPQVRAEDLDVAQWVALTEAVIKAKSLND